MRVYIINEGRVFMPQLVALTGAGISKGSGIPTLQEMGDLREKLSREYFQNHA